MGRSHPRPPGTPLRTARAQRIDSLIYTVLLEVFKMIFSLVLGPPPPPPGGSRGRHCLKEIVGFGLIPVRIQGFLIFMLALSTAGSCSELRGLVGESPGAPI